MMSLIRVLSDLVNFPATLPASLLNRFASGECLAQRVFQLAKLGFGDFRN